MTTVPGAGERASTPLPPATGAWREGDDPGDRRFAEVGPLRLDLGGALPAVTVAYETWGTPGPDSPVNAVLVLHALTGDSHVVGAAGPAHRSAGWWPGLIGPGAPVDTDRFFVVAANVFGGCQGTTGPSSIAPDGRPWGSRFPRITIGDQVRAEALLARTLGIERWVAVIGGSMGGMRALEWAVSRPGAVGSALFLASGAVATADQIGTQTTQVRAITSDPRWRGGDYHYAAAGDGPHEGMGLARRIAHLTYRCESELQTRFGNDHQDGEDPLRDGRFAVESYLDHHAEKLAHRFDAGSYVALTDAMTTWDAGRGRGGLDAALTRVTAPVVVAGIDTDRLYPLHLQRDLAERLPAAGGLRVVPSAYGHDGFLLERDRVGDLVAETLALGTSSAAGAAR